MKEFKSWQDYWHFAHVVRSCTRYIHHPDIRDFLDAVLATLRNRVKTLPLGGQLWRAQLGHDEADQQIGEDPVPHRPERMKPIEGRSPEGRVNPKGISYLYLATERDTALAEVHPWKGSLVSVGLFKACRELHVVNCTTDERGTRAYFAEPSPEKRENAVWCDIDRAFARPVTRSDDVAEYVPTQVIAELFKVHDYDGVAYRSSLGAGHNVALFDLQAVGLVGCRLFELKAMTFDFQEVANPYYLQEREDSRRDQTSGPNSRTNMDG